MGTATLHSSSHQQRHCTSAKAFSPPYLLSGILDTLVCFCVRSDTPCNSNRRAWHYYMRTMARCLAITQRWLLLFGTTPGNSHSIGGGGCVGAHVGGRAWAGPPENFPTPSLPSSCGRSPGVDIVGGGGPPPAPPPPPMTITITIYPCD